MINYGSEVLYGGLKDIKSKFKKHSVQVNVEGEIGDISGVIEKKDNKGSIELVLEPSITPQIILDRLRDRGISINRFEVTTPSLNEIFIDVAGGNHE
jgi:ABC-2 type transport system ATP-binding protein